MVSQTSHPRVASARAILALAALAAFSVSLLAAAPADAARPLLTGFAEPQYKVASERNFLLNQTVKAKARVIRVDVRWRGVTKAVPANPTSPSAAAYDFSTIDATVKRARAKGLQVLLSVRDAPRFAEGPGRPNRVKPGTWKPRPAKLREFAEALARRYSGRFSPPGRGRLPRVRFYQGWNEWTSEQWLSPGRQKGKLFAPFHYRKMIRAFFAGVKKVRRNNVVVTGGTNPFGGRGKEGVRIIPPVEALRAFFCLRNNLKPRARCKDRPQLNGLDHHAINPDDGPLNKARKRDDATSGDFGKIRRVLRAAERAGTVRPKGRRPLWVTESWFESKPPDRQKGVPLAKQARWVQQNLYVLWRQGAKYVLNIQVRDSKIDRRKPAFSLQGGLLFANGKRKPAFRAFRFPFVGDRKSRKKVLIWGKAPRNGRLRIQVRRGGGWKTIKRIRARNNKTFKTRIRLRKKRGAHKLRGRVGAQKSLAWRQG